MKEYQILKNKLESIPELEEEEIFHLEEENKKQIEILKNNKKTRLKVIKIKSITWRDILRKDGKIERLEDVKKDMKERYNELREDLRYQKRCRDENR